MTTHTEQPAPTNYVFDGMYIDGEWRGGQSGSLIVFSNPWTERTIGSIIGADPCDVDVAYALAQTNQPVWASTLPGERAAVFHRVTRLIEARRSEIQCWLVREAGSTLAKAQIEWWAVHNSVVETATLPSWLHGRIIFGDYSAKENRIYRRPVGVVAVISPWNWPLHLSMRSVAPALALGNAVVLKPATDTPVTGGLLIARLLKRALLELGGNAPLIVTEDVDLEQAVQNAVAGKFLRGGQMCIAVNRIIVADAIHDRFVDLFIACCRSLKISDPDDPETAFGPVINHHQLQRLQGLLSRAHGNGARLRLGGAAKGLNLPPQVFDQVTPDMTIAQQEIFGPIAPILRACDDKEAVQIANATDYGLSSAVLCRNEGRALDIAQRIEAGMTHINDSPAIDLPQLPFGGGKNSCMGRFGSPGMIEAFTTEHWISVQRSPTPFPF
jgi:aldehyde dehydrogenase (NAD+)